MIKAIIVDDEKPSAQLLQRILQRYYPGIKVLASARSRAEAIAGISEKKPDILFLDVELAGKDGFSLLSGISDEELKVILISGYHASDLHSEDSRIVAILEKPLVLKELRVALEASGLDFREEVKGLVLKQDQQSQRYLYEDIEFIEAQRAYALLHLDGGRQKIASQALREFEKKVPDYFFRIHKSYLVNGKKVLSVEPGRGGKVRLQGGQDLPIAYRRKAAFIEFLKEL